MTNINNFGLIGIGSNVRFGKGGNRIANGTDGLSVLNSSGLALTHLSIAAPTADDHAVTKSYVDSLVQGLVVKPAARVATVANIDLETGGLLEIDGVQTIAGDIVLVKNQTNAVENGLYTVAAGEWVRGPQMNESHEVPAAFTFVVEGDTNAGKGYVVTGFDEADVIDVDPINWTLFSSSGAYTAGNGLELNGSVFSVKLDGTDSGLIAGGNGLALLLDGTNLQLSNAGLNLTTTGVTAGSGYNSFTVDAFGRITSATTVTTGTGSVTSVAISGDNGIDVVSGSPITGAGTIALTLTDITPDSVVATGDVTGANLSGTNTGDQTITLSGDATGSGTAGITVTLSDTGVVAGTGYNSFEVDSKGRIIAATTVTTGTGSVTSVAISGTDGISVLSGSPITGAGTIALGLEDSGVVAGTYNSLTVDAKGRVTSGTNVTIGLDDLGDVVLTSPVLDQVLKFDGTNWVNATDTTGTGTLTSIVFGDGLNGGTITQSGTVSLKLDEDRIGDPHSGSGLSVGSDGVKVLLNGFGVVTSDQGIGLTIGDGLDFDMSGTDGYYPIMLSDIGTAGTYNQVTVDAKGRIISGTNITTGTGSVTSVAVGNGLTTGTAPITGAGTINLVLDGTANTSGLVVGTAGLKVALTTDGGLITNNTGLGIDLQSNAGLVASGGQGLRINLASASGLVLTSNQLAMDITTLGLLGTASINGATANIAIFNGTSTGRIVLDDALNASGVVKSTKINQQTITAGQIANASNTQNIYGIGAIPATLKEANVSKVMFDVSTAFTGAGTGYYCRLTTRTGTGAPTFLTDAVDVDLETVGKYVIDLTGNTVNSNGQNIGIQFFDGSNNVVTSFSTAGIAANVIWDYVG